jgi:hypothetical protein
MRKLAVIALALSAGTVSGQNLLNNPGFESDLGFDFSNLENWNGFFGGPAGTFLQAFNDTGTAPLSGAKALELTIQGDANFPTTGFDAFTGHVQTIPGLSAGTEYEFSVWARSDGNVDNAAEMRIEWFDAGGATIGDTGNLVYQDSLTTEYQQFSIGGIAPAGTVGGRAVLAVQSFTNNGIIADMSIALDDASLVAVPAPASAALLGLGGLAAIRRRR